MSEQASSPGHGTDPMRAFLEALGLAQYAAAFAEQAIDLELLPELTDAQLEQLGVKALGHRIKLRRAAAERRGAAVVPSPIAAPSPATVPLSVSLPAGAERRQLTVMFCDLVGSTALSQRLDPEDLRALMQRYQRVCGEVIERHKGTVAQVMGDGLMVYFGWPRAREDDAGRAVLAALNIIDVIKGVDAADPPQVRIGIATGPVVVGRNAPTLDGDANSPSLAVGETPNLAARVQAAAEPDQVLIAASTRRLVAEAFRCEDLGERELKGISTPVRLWRVLGEGRAEGRFAAAHGATLTAMVNRELEISLLMDRWARACEGQGQAVLLAGDPGIGKSRVLAELCARVPPESLVMHLQCSELHANSAFYPFTAQLQRAAGLERGDAPEARLDKLEALLQRIGPGALAQARYFAQLLSLPTARYAAFTSSPAKIKQDTIEAFVATLREAARSRPLLLVAEDLHWMDPSSLEAIDALIDGLRREPMLLVMTSRTGMGSRWASRPAVTTLTMVGLNRTHSLQLASAVAAAHGLTEQLLQRIVERTDGVPLFLEELTRTLAEGAALRPGQRADLIEIPSTLKDSLAARLDQLGSARRLAQLGALLGREFRHSVLAALHGGSETEIAEQMEQLIAAGLASRSGTPPEAVYTFHHALIQDAAYESLLRSERRVLHARAGDILKSQFAELGDTEPELLARHYTAGENWAEAVPLWLKAGQRAWARSAAQEAISHLEAGLALVDRVPDRTQRDTLELRLQSALGVVYFAAVSYAAPQTRKAFERASALCESIGDVALTAPVRFGMGAYLIMKGDARAGHGAFERLRAEADASGQPRLQLTAQSVLAWSHVVLGEHDRGIAAAERALHLYDGGALQGPRLSAADPKIVTECFRALALWALGHVDRARAVSDGLLAHARALGDPYTLVYTLTFAALLVPDLRGERDTVLARSEEGIRLAHELGYPFLEVTGIALREWNLAQGGDAAAALAALDTALERLDTMGVRFHHGQLLARRARLQLRLGQAPAAQLTVARALADVEASGIGWNRADIYLAEGEVLLAHGGEQRGLAAAAFQLAMDAARAQGARSWQLRSAIAQARLAAETEGPAAARRILEPVLVPFTEGHDTADLKEAAGLLAQWR